MLWFLVGYGGLSSPRDWRAIFDSASPGVRVRAKIWILARIPASNRGLPGIRALCCFGVPGGALPSDRIHSWDIFVSATFGTAGVTFGAMNFWNRLTRACSAEQSRFTHGNP